MQEEKTLLYNWLPMTVSKNGMPSLDVRCNSITLINYGTSIITINGNIILYPGVPGTRSGESIAMGGNRNELFKGSVDVAFDSIVPAANRLLILQKIYV